MRAVAVRLKRDWLRVWFHPWEIKRDDTIPAKIEEGLKNSRVLVPCMSANALRSDWGRLEAGTFRLRNPLSKERRFLLLRLEDAAHHRLPGTVLLHQLGGGESISSRDLLPTQGNS